MALVEQLKTIKGVKRTFTGSFFHEAAITLSVPVENVLQKLKAQRILAGLNLKDYYPELGHTILLCATETKIPSDLIKFAECLNQVLSKQSTSTIEPA
jgi:glycine dehydrogenase subunit 1